MALIGDVFMIIVICFFVGVGWSIQAVQLGQSPSDRGLSFFYVYFFLRVLKQCLLSSHTPAYYT